MKIWEYQKWRCMECDMPCYAELPCGFHPDVCLKSYQPGESLWTALGDPHVIE